jgi:TolA-binding protein
VGVAAGALGSVPAPAVAGAWEFSAEIAWITAFCSDAITAYTAVITNFKGSPWEDQAYYARGLAYEELAMKDQARADFQYIIKNFPDSTYVPLSKSALERIK